MTRHRDPGPFQSPGHDVDHAPRRAHVQHIADGRGRLDDRDEIRGGRDPENGRPRALERALDPLVVDRRHRMATGPGRRERVHHAGWRGGPQERDGRTARPPPPSPAGEVDEVSVPGRGWVMVRSASLKEDDIVKAMKAGDFYSSSGVTLKDVRKVGDRLELEIDGRPGIEYRTEFIATRMVEGKPGEIGEIVSTSTSLTPGHTMQGDELYLRARITSSRPHPRPYLAGDMEMAWTQPVRPASAEGTLSDQSNNHSPGDNHDSTSQ